MDDAKPQPSALATVGPEQAPVRTPFSGVIVYRQTALSNSSPPAARNLGDLHYFVSGSHWKHADANGDTLALYDPEANLIHYFKPQRQTVSAAEAKDPATFEKLAEKKTVLGHECKALRLTSAGVSFVMFYDSAVFVEPELYKQHNFGHWAETLALTHGGLTLASRTEMPEGVIVSEAILIESRTFEPSFWRIPDRAPDEARKRVD